ncbi:monosaccharide ABC transporter substrate-binding protein, CUT2 family [Singulisphaera sp. GP187]|uniref:substrate-binding domain-containing protein n=1 Tax=Singulisphaera sp. GP187 TaxID=1882752 RepID=UPI000929EBB7|nr:substrate-binding domain-containing protein [Singulisphaera sp. GP187]SIN81351.1 monosaccharide ABC transporter substrate-binding protein, CUT2 family [Singulisphaera sp. GP187]
MHSTWTLRKGRWLCVLALLISTGCGESKDASLPKAGSDASKGPKILFITNGNSDWWSAVEKGMHDGAAKFGAQVEMRRNDGQREGQIRLLEDALSRSDVQGVAVSVLDAATPGIADKMRELQAQGKVVITIDSDGQPDTRKAYIGTNNRKAGEVAGKVTAMLRPQGGTVAMFVGVPSAANAIERHDGFFAGAGKAFTEAEVFSDDNDLARALTNVQTAIEKYPAIGVLVGIWSYNAPRIAEEVGKFPDLRKRVTVVTFDLDEQAVEHVEKGRIDAAVCQNPYEMGYQGVQLVKALVEKDQSTIESMLPGGSSVIDTGVRVIVPTKESPVKGDNVIDIKSMKEWLTSKGLKSS